MHEWDIHARSARARTDAASCISSVSAAEAAAVFCSSMPRVLEVLAPVMPSLKRAGDAGS